MSEWIARQWSDVGACWLQCPNCLAVTRFDHHILITLYDPEPTKATPFPKPHAKCEACDFVPYLPMELKKVTHLEVVFQEQDGPTIWAPVDNASTHVRAETYGAPERLATWRNLKPD
jgi:hypothetical protein